VELTAGKAAAFLKHPEPQIRCFLFFGPDDGLIRERAEIIAKSVVEDLTDPFRVVELTGEEINADPARLPDEAAALSFGGGRRVVLVREATNQITDAVKTLLDTDAGDALIVLRAGELKRDSKLRKLIKQSDIAAGMPCYRDEGRVLRDAVTGILAEYGLSADADAANYLVDHLGGDRAMTRRELETLALYASTVDRNSDERITIEEAQAVVGDSAQKTLSDLCGAVGDGNHALVDRCYARAMREGSTTVGVIRALSGHFMRLLEYRRHIQLGDPPQIAARKLRPPVHFSQADSFRRQANAFNEAFFAKALTRLTDVEIKCKSTGMPDIAICSQSLLSLTAEARRLQSRR
jgi:DNA polymerase III subunit delta